MTILLGVDTGGTYTDAVLIRDDTDVIASAKVSDHARRFRRWALALRCGPY
jgi:N-methylhydantoinase A/oxoprolinase/acetone carboxylase beta subunit